MIDKSISLYWGRSLLEWTLQVAVDGIKTK